jgi:heat shock protein HslJ
MRTLFFFWNQVSLLDVYFPKERNPGKIYSSGGYIVKINRLQTSLFLVLIALLTVIALAACTTGSDQTTLVGPEWRLASTAGEAVPAEVSITATFGNEEVTGSSGCNSYSGPYKVDGDKIQFGPMVSTLMACDEPMMSWEGNYLKALQAAQNYTVSGNLLEITTGEGVLKFNSD